MAFPYLHDLIQALTGLSVPLPLPTFGACVVIAVFAAMGVARSELVRMQRAGRLARLPADGGRPDGQPLSPARVTEIAGELASLVVLAGLADWRSRRSAMRAHRP